MGARLSRLENLVGNLVRVVGEQPRPQNAPVSRGERGFVVYPAGAGRCWEIIAMCFSFFVLAIRGGLDLGELPPAVELHAIQLTHGEVRYRSPTAVRCLAYRLGWSRTRGSTGLLTWSGACCSTSLHLIWSGARRSTNHRLTWSGARRSTGHLPIWSGARRSTNHHLTWSGARRPTCRHPTWSGAHRSTRTCRTRLGTCGSINQAVWPGARSLTN